MTITRALAVAFALLLAACAPAQNAADQAAIASLMRATWGRADAPLAANPIVVSGDHAVADWTQGANGGRALLRKANGAWTIVLCAGDAIRTAESLVQAGVPDADARVLADALARAERGVSADRLAAMARFEGLVRMDGAAGAITISDAWIATPPSGVHVAAGYMTISNSGEADDRLVALASPRARLVEAHEMVMDGAVMKMQAVQALVVPARGGVTLAPGGLHIMFIGMNPRFADGETIPLTLTFENGGAIERTLVVRARSAGHGGHQ